MHLSVSVTYFEYQTKKNLMKDGLVRVASLFQTTRKVFKLQMMQEKFLHFRFSFHFWKLNIANCNFQCTLQLRLMFCNCFIFRWFFLSQNHPNWCRIYIEIVFLFHFCRFETLLTHCLLTCIPFQKANFRYQFCLASFHMFHMNCLCQKYTTKKIVFVVIKRRNISTTKSYLTWEKSTYFLIN